MLDNILTIYPTKVYYSENMDTDEYNIYRNPEIKIDISITAIVVYIRISAA